MLRRSSKIKSFFFFHSGRMIILSSFSTPSFKLRDDLYDDKSHDKYMSFSGRMMPGDSGEQWQFPFSEKDEQASPETATTRRQRSIFKSTLPPPTAHTRTQGPSSICFPRCFILFFYFISSGFMAICRQRAEIGT